MAAITAKMVSDLRAKTGCGMMECKKALTEANGDFDEAIKVLREKGLSVAAKKADRIAAEGVVDILVNDDNTCAAMIEVNAETDFVAKNATFLEFVQNIQASTGGDYSGVVQRENFFKQVNIITKPITSGITAYLQQQQYDIDNDRKRQARLLTGDSLLFKTSSRGL